MVRRVLILDDHAERVLGFQIAVLRVLPGFTPVRAETSRGFIEAFSEFGGEVELISLDHDPDPRRSDSCDGVAAAMALATIPPTCPIILHTPFDFEASSMLQILRRAGWPVYLVKPTSRIDWIAHDWAAKVFRIREQGWISP